MEQLNARDQAWIEALRPYLGGGIVPIFRNDDGTVNAAKTIGQFCKLKGAHKLDPRTGAELVEP